MNTDERIQTYDIETADWDTYVMGGLDIENGLHEIFRQPEDLFDAMQDIGGTFYAHNGGHFDAIWYIGLALDRQMPCEIFCAGSKIVGAKIGAITLRDSAALIPMSLKKAAAMAGISMAKDTGLACICEDDCGGYCTIKKDMLLCDYNKLAAYLSEDLVSTTKMIRAVFSIADRCGYQLRSTIGASAYATAEKWLGLEPADWQWRDYKWVRGGYYGGRCQVFRPVVCRGHCYDIHSAYPAALSRIDLPVGESLMVAGSKATRAFDRSRPGIYEVEIAIPDKTWIPPLPVTVGDRMTYPTGIVVGRWPQPEIEYAMSRGAILQEVRQAMVWTDEVPVLRPFAEKVWVNRDAANIDAESKLHKWFANSLTGKLAQRPEADIVITDPDEHEIVRCDCPGKCYGRCNSWNQIDRVGRIWSKPKWRINDCAHVHWAAYLTAATRLQLHEQLYGQGDADAVYCDTDSVYSKRERVGGIGPDLGDWGYDGPMTDFVALGPKAYCYTDTDGKRIVKCKGLSGISAEKFDDYIAGLPVIMEKGVMGFRSSARRSSEDTRLFQKHEFSRSSHHDGIHYGDRIRDGDITRPQNIKALLP